MRLLLLVAVLLFATPAQAHHARLSADQAANRARITARGIAEKSVKATRYTVATNSCHPVGTTGHRRDCTAVFTGRDTRCTLRIRVRFRSSSSTGTVASFAFNELRC